MDMKKIKFIPLAFMTLLTAAILFTGCKKNSSETLSAEEFEKTVVTTEAEMEADVLFDGVFDDVAGVGDDIGMGSGIGNFGRPTDGDGNGEILLGRTDSNHVRCFTITVTPMQPNVFPKTVVLDFGTGCVGPDGRTRKGKITTVYSGRLSIPGSEATTTFTNFFVDSIKVEGTHIVKNTSTSNNQSFSIKVIAAKLTKPNGNYTEWNKTRTWVQTQGNGTPNFLLDDVFSITGDANGTIKVGTNMMQWTTTITSPIIRKHICRWPVSGTVDITRNSRTATLDYGNGTCDNKATITANGHVRIITLR
jgi:hypothetical protein